jgi:energy-converting hydrogenase Eha subunit A
MMCPMLQNPEVTCKIRIFRCIICIRYSAAAANSVLVQFVLNVSFVPRHSGRHSSLNSRACASTPVLSQPPEKTRRDASHQRTLPLCIILILIVILFLCSSSHLVRELVALGEKVHNGPLALRDVTPNYKFSIHSHVVDGIELYYVSLF